MYIYTWYRSMYRCCGSKRQMLCFAFGLQTTRNPPSCFWPPNQVARVDDVGITWRVRDAPPLPPTFPIFSLKRNGATEKFTRYYVFSRSHHTSGMPLGPAGIGNLCDSPAPPTLPILLQETVWNKHNREMNATCGVMSATPPSQNSASPLFFFFAKNERKTANREVDPTW